MTPYRASLNIQPILGREVGGNLSVMVMMMVMVVFACVSLAVDHAVECTDGLDIVPNDMSCTQLLGLYQRVMLGNILPAVAMVSAVARGTVNLAEQMALFHVIVMDNLGQGHGAIAEEKTEDEQNGR